MIFIIGVLLCSAVIIDSRHFNGGTIRWEPVNPYTNSTSVPITIIQIYSWTYPTIACDKNVPITTNGRGADNANLTCIADCSTDGGYSTKPVNILTDCTSVSASLGMLTSQRAVNITLNADAHFYVSYLGSAWIALNDPAVGGRQWSITSFIDLRRRPDGFINTPPVASVVSPQYAIVNRATQIKIPVSDANGGDDVRCRWSTYTPGENRRKRWIDEQDRSYDLVSVKDDGLVTSSKTPHITNRAKRGSDSCYWCKTQCWDSCSCNCPGCIGTNCGKSSCKAGSWKTCPPVTTPSGATTPSTTSETPGTLAPTTSYNKRQAIDECGGICYPGSVPAGTTLSNCTISFIGLKVGTWYGISVQVSTVLVVILN